MSLKTEINNRYNKNIFINNPKYDSNIEVLYDKIFNKNNELFSIIVPIHNQEEIIRKNITSMLTKTQGKPYEIILILDACSDQSEKEVLSLFNSLEINNYTLLTHALILKSTIPLFETAADNLGFSCAKGKYLLEIQSDMTMTEDGYNMKLLKPFLIDDKIIGMSGRCGHSFKNSYFVGKCGADINDNIDNRKDIDKKSYYISETCNRGPLLLDAKKLREMGYLDEVNYFLDNSDHDLFARAYHEKEYICGYVPINFEADLVHGSTRKKRDELNQKYYDLKKQTTNEGKNGFLQQYKDMNIQLREVKKYELKDDKTIKENFTLSGNNIFFIITGIIVGILLLGIGLFLLLKKIK